jgi:putative chitinase
MALNSTQLLKLFPAAGGAYLDQVADEIGRDSEAYRLDTPLRLAHFFAQIRQECGPALHANVESLAYSPQALIATFKYYKDHPDEADQDGYLRDSGAGVVTRPAAQEAIANKVYANRNGNGGVDSGDGWRYRGRGFIQVTGRGNYASVNATCQQLYPDMHVDFVVNPDAMGSFPGALRSAIGFWVSQGLPAVADRGSTDEVVNTVTGIVDRGTASGAARIANFAIAFNAFRS